MSALAQRTDHSVTVTRLRDTAERVSLDSQKIILIAASDLLELHDSTALNLHTAPRLLAFVELISGEKVDNNNA